MESTNYIIRYLAFTGGLEVEEAKASLQEPTFQDTFRLQGFSADKKKEVWRLGLLKLCLEDMRESKAKPFTRTGDNRHFSEPKNISQSSIQNIPLKN